MNTKKKVQDFWIYFLSIVNRLENDFENTGIADEIDLRIQEFGDLSWEIGPGISKEYSFVISPNSDKELLHLSKQIVSDAPKINNWEFYYAKPIKRWDYKFEMTDSNDNLISIDASNWKYVLFEYDDNTFDIIIQAPGLQSLDARTKELVVDFVLVSCIGEELFMDAIKEVEIVSEFPADIKPKGSNIQVLYNIYRNCNSL